LNGQAYINGELSTLSGIYSGGGVTANGGVSTNGGISATSTTITPVDQASAQAILNRRRTIFDGTFKPVLTAASQVIAILRDYLRGLYNGERSYFNAVQSGADAKASLRSTEDYGTQTSDGFYFFEIRWQQYARAAGTGKRWAERPVPSAKGDTYPWPGNEAWTQPRLGIFTMTSFDITAGTATEANAFATAQSKTMAGDYVTNSAEE
jgi:hypothetical protein